MEWRGRRQSGNVDDRRGMKVAGALGGGGLIVALIIALLGGDPSVILNQLGGSGESRDPATVQSDDEAKQFISVVLADTEDVWNEVFQKQGQAYQEPRLVLFNGRVQSACGMASSAVGPFYCPSDQQVYIDLDFFKELSGRLGASGDFAQAYVLAHEVGHHVQNLRGTMDKVHGQQQSGGARANEQSVRLELQADCFAGMWAQATEKEKQVLEDGDMEEALQAAAAVGDDRLQMQSQGSVVPDSFTHGTSEQRAHWFSRGFEAKSIDDCDTFASQDLL